MEELKNRLEKEYGIEIANMEKIKNSYRLSTPEGFMCFKESRYDRDQFQFIISSIEHVMSKGFQSVLPFYKTLDGKNFIKTDKGYGFMCPWINSREADFKNPVELRLCLKTLAQFHLYSRGAEGKVPGCRSLQGKWIQRFKKRCDQLLYFKALISLKEKKSQFDVMYLRSFDIHYRQALKAIRDLEGSSYLNIMENQKSLMELCHHDTANHNFLITPDCNMYMIDFDYCIQDSHLHDLASIIIRNMKYGNWSLDVLEFILEGYTAWIPVSEEELYVIFCFMEFPQDFWQIGLQYYVEKQPWEEDFFERKLNRIMGDSRDRMDFLREFEAMFLEGYNGAIGQ